MKKILIIAFILAFSNIASAEKICLNLKDRYESPLKFDVIVTKNINKKEVKNTIEVETYTKDPLSITISDKEMEKDFYLDKIGKHITLSTSKKESNNMKCYIVESSKNKITTIPLNIKDIELRIKIK